MKEIESTKDITLLIELFYDKLLHDEETRPLFEQLDLKAHIPRVVQFWAFILLDSPGYQANMMEKHAHLPLTESLFEKWLFLFHQTIDELYTGEKAELAKQRSTLIAWTMKSKFKIN